jgi:hypothetical protein
VSSWWSRQGELTLEEMTRRAGDLYRTLLATTPAGRPHKK